MRDVIVVGAGAAGVGAGLALLRQGKDFLILEAKDRGGGRAHSDSQSLGRIWDHGCHWFHSASINPLRNLALKLDHPFVDAPRPYGEWLWRDGAFADPHHYEADLQSLAERMTAQSRASGDTALATLLDVSSPWHAAIRHDMALTYSQEPEDISVADGNAFNDTGENTPVAGGYGNLVARLARLLPIRLSLPVTAVTVTANAVRLATAEGELEARQVIVAVPQRVLERGLIKFSPRLPQDITEAIENLPMGWFEKAGFAFDAPVFGDKEDSGVEILARIAGEDWPTPVQISPGLKPIAICHIAGHRARDLAADERIALCEEALVQCFGSGIGKHVTRRATSAWASDPYIGGAYSCARPGMSGVRRRFHDAVHERIQFAGEHTSTDAMATAHGAFLSGHAAAMRALGLPHDAAEPLWLPGDA